MSKYSIEQFIKETKQDELENEYFELETPRILEVNLKDLGLGKDGLDDFVYRTNKVRAGKNVGARSRSNVQKSVHG